MALWAVRADSFITSGCEVFQFFDRISSKSDELDFPVLDLSQVVVLRSLLIGGDKVLSGEIGLSLFFMEWGKSRGWSYSNLAPLGYNVDPGFGDYLSEGRFIREVFARAFARAMGISSDSYIFLPDSYECINFPYKSDKLDLVFEVSYRELCKIADEMFTHREAEWLRMFSGVMQCAMSAASAYELQDFFKCLEVSYGLALEVMEGFSEAFYSSGGLLADSFFRLCFDPTIVNREEDGFSFLQMVEYLSYTYC